MMRREAESRPVRRKQGFRRRDILLLIGCMVGLLLSFQGDGEASFKEGFVAVWGEDMHVDAITKMPKPLVTDVDGDGQNDIIATTAPETLCILSNYRPSRSAGGYVQEVTPKFTARASSIIIGLGAGSLQKNEKVAVPVVLLKKPDEKKHVQHIVVVTDDYLVTLYNHEMVEEWVVRLPVPEPKDNYMYDEINEAEDLYGWFYPTSATVTVLPNQIYQGDVGVVVVGMLHVFSLQ